MNPESGLGRIFDGRHPLAAVLLLGLAVRLVLMPFFTFNIDMSYWLKAVNLIDSGQNLYGIGGYYYTPVWGYVLGLVDVLMHLVGVTDFGTVSEEMAAFTGLDYSISPMVTSIWFNIMVKIPLIITDLVVGYLIYRFVLRISGDERKSLIGCALWIFCPLTILESSMHGMFDNISAMFLLICMMEAHDRRYAIAGMAFSLAIMTKFFPAFLMFLLIAMVLRNEGINARGFTRLGIAVLSAAVTMLVVEIPAIITGRFWDSMKFLVGRMGLSVETMNSIPATATILAPIVLAALAVSIVLYFIKVRPDIPHRLFLDLPKERREHLVRRFILVAGIASTILILLYSVVSVMLSDSSTLVDVFNDIGMRIVMLLSVYTLLIELYIGYRFLFSERDDAFTVCFMLSSVVIFLWPPAPQYVMVIVPSIAIYAAVTDGGYVKTLMAFGALMGLYDLILAGPSILFSVAEYSSMVAMDALIPSVEFITSYVGPIPTIAFFMGVFGVAAYLSMLNILYRWLKANRGAFR